jgi:ABC-type transport system involved in multi-copper enzyme maturation permease subunit
MFNIALNTFREMVRNRLFSLIIFLSIILIALSLGLDSLALGENKRVIIDFGLSFIELSWLAVILFLAWGLIAREIDGRTIYLMLSKPIRRWMIIFGKFSGFAVVLFFVFIIELLILIAILFSQGVVLDSIFFLATVWIFLKLLSLLALSLLFSTIVSPGLAMLMTIVSTIIGHGGYAILEYALRSGDHFYLYFARGVLIFFPNLESLNLKNLVATTAIIDINTYLIAYVLSFAYTMIVLFLAAWFFERKSFDAV